jgi:hypothetical protein
MFRIVWFAKNYWLRFDWNKIEILQNFAHLSACEIIEELIKQHIEDSWLRMLRLQTKFNNLFFIHFENVFNSAILFIFIIINHQAPWITYLENFYARNINSWQNRIWMPNYVCLFLILTHFLTRYLLAGWHNKKAHFNRLWYRVPEFCFINFLMSYIFWWCSSQTADRIRCLTTDC